MVTHVRYYRLMPCGTTAASQAPEVPPPSTGLYQTSGTTAPLSGSTGACVRAYIYSTGLKGCLFPFVLVPLLFALAAGHLYPCPGVRLALRILGSPWILSVEASRSLPMDGGNASCSLLLDLSRVLPLSRALLNFPRLVFELWSRRDLCLPPVLFAALRIRNITCVIRMPRLDLSSLVVPLSAVLPPLRAVQPLERYYRRKIRYNRSISTTKHCSIFSVVATCSFSASGCNPLILVGFLCVLFVCVFRWL